MGRIQKIQKLDSLRSLAILRCMTVSFLLVVLLSSCATYRRVRVDKQPEVLKSAQAEIPESNVLDVRIQVFDPGELPKSENAARGISEVIRQAESKYMAIQLKNAMQQSGYWGAVRVIPAPAPGDEVLVTGRILESTGEVLKLNIKAFDARGIQWFDKDFKGAVNEEMLTKASDGHYEAFQNVYYRIANELAEHYRKMTPQQILEVRRIAEMKFAQALVPIAFDDYVKKDEKSGQFTLDRLPSEDDEMLARVRRVRERDYMLVDTLDAHYENLNHEMGGIYTNWRKSRLMEMNLIRKADDAKNKKLAAGSLLVLAGIALGVLAGDSGNYNPALGAGVGAAVGIGAMILLQAAQAGEETAINKAALEELGVSFTAEVEPTVLKVEGKTIELTGSAEAKYQQWQEVLGKLYRVETEPEELPPTASTLESRVPEAPPVTEH